jgi:hypothetical protein
MSNADRFSITKFILNIKLDPSEVAPAARPEYHHGVPIFFIYPTTGLGDHGFLLRAIRANVALGPSSAWRRPTMEKIEKTASRSFFFRI